MLLLSSLLGASALTNQYSLSLKPFPNYDFHWKTDNENFYIALNVSADGWIGFGISEPTSGSMPGSDMFRAYVDANGQATIQDGYALGKIVPVADNCQDWTLVSSERVGGRTIVEARRKLVTGDPQDRPVSTTAVSRLVFAFSASSSFSVGHGADRMGLAVNLADGTMPVYEPTGAIQYFDIRNSHKPDQTQVTEYWDDYFPVPIAGPVHMIGAAILSDSPYFNLVHHVTLAGYYPDQTTHYLYIWAPGVGDLELKAPCGFRFGNASASSITMLHMQTHYNNPARSATGIDTTGVRIYYTTTLRNNDCGVINFGDPNVELARKGESLPSGISSWEITCPASLTNALQNRVMTVFASALHMHGLGQQMWTTVNDVVQNKIEFYDFGFQQTTDLLGKGFTIKAGDVIKTTCVYNAPDANQVFGLASNQEMCINYVFYYPRVPTSSCGVETTGVTYVKTPRSELHPRAFAATNGACTQSPTAPGTTTEPPTPIRKGGAAAASLAPVAIVAVAVLAAMIN